MKPMRNGVEGDGLAHCGNETGLDKPLFEVDTDKGPSDHAPERVRAKAAKPRRANSQIRRLGRPQ